MTACAMFTVLGGCQMVAYDKPGVSDAQFRADVGLCGGTFTRSGGIEVEDSKLNAVSRCMARKGYTVTNY